MISKKSLLQNFVKFIFLIFFATNSLGVLASDDSCPLDHSKVRSHQSPISLIIKADRDEIEMNGIFPIRVFLANISGKAIQIYRPHDWGEFGGIRFWMRSMSTKKDVALSVIPSPAPPIEPLASDMVVLMPGKCITFDFSVAMSDYSVPSGGEYKIWLTYRSPILNSMPNTKLNVITSSKGRFSSNKLVLHLISK